MGLNVLRCRANIIITDKSLSVLRQNVGLLAAFVQLLVKAYVSPGCLRPDFFLYTDTF